MPGSHRAAAVPRRLLVTGLLAAGSLTACDLPGGPSPSAGPSGAAASPADADEQVVSDALAVLGAARDRVHATLARFPTLHDDLAPLVRLHERHAAALAGRAHGRGRFILPGSASAARAGVVDAEQRLQRDLAALAVRASSGALAGLVASMAAAVAQQVAVLGPRANTP